MEKTLQSSSLRSLLKQTSEKKLIEILGSFSDEEQQYFWYDWENLWARDKQQIPNVDFGTWLIMSGRGFGKTRTGVETCRIWKDNYPIINIVGRTASDVRDIIIEGEGGVLRTAPPWDKPIYQPAKKRVTWPNGAQYRLFSAEEPDSLRGPQCYKAYCDEFAAWKYPRDAWENLQYGLRLGDNPQTIITTTPRPIKILKEIIKEVDTFLTTGSSYENKGNVSDKWFDRVIGKYEGTSRGRQEIYAELLDEVEGALFARAMIEHVKSPPVITKTVLSIDPAVSSKKSAKGAEPDETALCVTGLGSDGRAHVLHSESGIWTPKDWADRAFALFQSYDVDYIVAEVNNGGDLVEANLRNQKPQEVGYFRYKGIHAYKGKVLRADPVIGLYEKGRVAHVGAHAKLEDEMTTWDPNVDTYSPNNLDAMVYGVTELLVKPQAEFSAESFR